MPFRFRHHKAAVYFRYWRIRMQERPFFLMTRVALLAVSFVLFISLGLEFTRLRPMFSPRTMEVIFLTVFSLIFAALGVLMLRQSLRERPKETEKKVQDKTKTSVDDSDPATILLLAYGLIYIASVFEHIFPFFAYHHFGFMLVGLITVMGLYAFSRSPKESIIVILLIGGMLLPMFRFPNIGIKLFLIYFWAVSATLLFLSQYHFKSLWFVIVLLFALALVESLFLGLIKPPTAMTTHEMWLLAHAFFYLFSVLSIVVVAKRTRKGKTIKKLTSTLKKTLKQTQNASEIRFRNLSLMLINLACFIVNIIIIHPYFVGSYHIILTFSLNSLPFIIVYAGYRRTLSPQISNILLNTANIFVVLMLTSIFGRQPFLLTYILIAQALVVLWFASSIDQLFLRIQAYLILLGAGIALSSFLLEYYWSFDAEQKTYLYLFLLAPAIAAFTWITYRYQKRYAKLEDYIFKLGLAVLCFWFAFVVLFLGYQMAIRWLALLALLPAIVLIYTDARFIHSDYVGILGYLMAAIAISFAIFIAYVGIDSQPTSHIFHYGYYNLLGIGLFLITLRIIPAGYGKIMRRSIHALIYIWLATLIFLVSYIQSTQWLLMLSAIPAGIMLYEGGRHPSDFLHYAGRIALVVLLLFNILWAALSYSDMMPYYNMLGCGFIAGLWFIVLRHSKEIDQKNMRHFYRWFLVLLAFWLSGTLLIPSVQKFAILLSAPLLFPEPHRLLFLFDAVLLLVFLYIYVAQHPRFGGENKSLATFFESFAYLHLAVLLVVVAITLYDVRSFHLYDQDLFMKILIIELYAASILLRPFYERFYRSSRMMPFVDLLQFAALNIIPGIILVVSFVRLPEEVWAYTFWLAVIGGFVVKEIAEQISINYLIRHPKKSGESRPRRYRRLIVYRSMSTFQFLAVAFLAISATYYYHDFLGVILGFTVFGGITYYHSKPKHPTKGFPATLLLFTYFSLFLYGGYTFFLEREIAGGLYIASAFLFTLLKFREKWTGNSIYTSWTFRLAQVTMLVALIRFYSGTISNYSIVSLLAMLIAMGFYHHITFSEQDYPGTYKSRLWKTDSFLVFVLYAANYGTIIYYFIQLYPLFPNWVLLYFGIALFIHILVLVIRQRFTQLIAFWTAEGLSIWTYLEYLAIIFWSGALIAILLHRFVFL